MQVFTDPLQLAKTIIFRKFFEFFKNSYILASLYNHAVMNKSSYVMAYEMIVRNMHYVTWLQVSNSQICQLKIIS